MPGENITTETPIYKSLKNIFDCEKHKELWLQMQPGLLDVIMIGLEYPHPHKLNPMASLPFQHNPNLAFQWGATPEGVTYWRMVFGIWRDEYIPPVVPFYELEDLEEDEDD